jgi:hypothetical protein
MTLLNFREITWSRRTTDLLVLRQVLFDLFRCCKSLILLKVVGRVDLNHRPPGPEPASQKSLSHRPGVTYGTSGDKKSLSDSQPFATGNNKVRKEREPLTELTECRRITQQGEALRRRFLHHAVPGLGKLGFW